MAAPPSLTVPVLRFHVVALDRHEMPAPFGRCQTGLRVGLNVATDNGKERAAI